MAISSKGSRHISRSTRKRFGYELSLKKTFRGRSIGASVVLLGKQAVLLEPVGFRNSESKKKTYSRPWVSGCRGVELSGSCITTFVVVRGDKKGQCWAPRSGD